MFVNWKHPLITRQPATLQSLYPFTESFLDGEDKSLGLLFKLGLMYLCRVDLIIRELPQSNPAMKVNKPDAICPAEQPYA